MENKYPYFDRGAETIITQGHLPHWHQNSKIVFSTFRTADSLPPQVEAELYRLFELWRAKHPLPWNNETLQAYLAYEHNAIQEYLDACHGPCHLAHESIRGILTETLHALDGKGCLLHAYVVMPNHVHLLVETIPGQQISQIIGIIKRKSARSINTLLHRTGAFWQREHYDRLIRSDRHYVYVLNYIHRNPQFLSAHKYTLYTAPGVWNRQIVHEE